MTGKVGAKKRKRKHRRDEDGDGVCESCTSGSDGGAVGQAVVLVVVQCFNAAPDGLWFELSLRSTAGCGYPEKQTQLSLTPFVFFFVHSIIGLLCFHLLNSNLNFILCKNYLLCSLLLSSSRISDDCR